MDNITKNNEKHISKEDYIFFEDKRIWSKAKKRFLKGNVLPNGYVQVTLKCTDGKKRTFYYHRVIWYVFNGEIPDGYEVNHIDENKQNNALSNLNLMTHIQNINHGTRNERHAAKMKNHPLKSKPVIAVDKDGNVVMEFQSTNEVERQMNYSHSHISACCRNCYSTHKGNIYKGYCWYFKEEWLAMQKEKATPRKRELPYQLSL